MFIDLSVVHASLDCIRTTVADGVLRLNPHLALAPLANLGDVGALALMVKIHHLRLVHVAPVAEVVVVVVAHCGNSISESDLVVQGFFQ